jgi:signal transduction histidine kinase/ActR/RegA family two-component response regulator
VIPEQPFMSATLADQLLAVDVFSELLVSTDPSQFGRRLTEHLRELTGARTVMLIAHPEDGCVHRLIHVCPARRAALFSADELHHFCPGSFPDELPRRSADLPPEHPLRALLLRADVESVLRFPLRAGGGLPGTLLLLDLPGMDRIDETAEIVTHLSPVVALALKNSLAHERIEQQARDLERRVAERTGELEAANRALIASRLAAHNMMEDAVEARRRAEHTTADLLHEIAERRRAEEEQARLGAQLQQAQKMESVGRLAGGVAHDFNNMLGVILGHAELALGQLSPDEPLHADLQEIRKAAIRSADLTRQLLAFARKQTVAPRVLDLNETVSGMLSMLHRLIGEDLDLQWQPKAGLWPIKMDPSQIDQILANLCVNSRDAIVGVGRIAIETGHATFTEDACASQADVVPGDYVLLAVSDNGRGIDKDTLSHLFEPFFTTKAIGKGTGLGLATVYGIVKQNNGFVNVHSEPDQGTTFRIYLPRHAGRDGEGRTEGAGAPAPRGQETILLVEDEPGVLTLTTTMLRRQGYAVIPAATPGEAIGLAKAHIGRIHLLVTDVVMPEMNGRDLAGNLRSIYPTLRRLFMSGYTADVIAHHGVLDAGVHFIQKPFSIERLAAKVREALDREASEES